MCLSAHLYRCLQRPEENIDSPGAEVTGGCKALDIGAANYSHSL